MMRRFVFALALLPACAGLAKVVHYERSGTFDMPDVTNMSVGKAKDKLATAGITGSVDIVDNYVCDREDVKVGDVCSTAPPPGAGRSARTPTTLYTKPAPTAAPMIDVVGKTPEQAKQLLAAAGFKRVEIEALGGDDVDDGCQPQTVCRTSPPAGQDHSFGVITVLYVAPKYTRPRLPKPQPQPDPEEGRTDPPKPDPQQPKPDAPKPDAPKPPPKPEPIF
jgi:beta-lactam-binding protein with PASTA domain